MGQAAAMDGTWLYYALSTMAQCAAALAALIGFFGLWRQDRLRERREAVDQDIERLNKERHDLIFRHLAPDARDRAYSEQLSRFDQRIQQATTHRTEVRAQQQQLMDVLVRFLVGTLAVLAIAIVGLAFAEGLYTWVWPMRVFIIAAGFWLGGAPAYVILHAAGRARVMQQWWLRLAYPIRRRWGRVKMWRGSGLIGERLRGQWLRLRRGVGAPIRERVQPLERVIGHAGTRLRTSHGPAQVAGWLQSQWRRLHRKGPHNPG
jgi:cell division protein FtsB